MYEILAKPCGEYATNCYIVKHSAGDIVIDPGMGALQFIKTHSKHVAAILNTHGHYDHIWDNLAVAREYNAPIYTPRDDIFMLRDDGTGYESSDDIAKPVDDGECVEINGLRFIFHHFPGHTPGCSMIEFDNLYFSGDFLFERSIGRWDFEFSNAAQMVQSLQKAKALKDDFALLPGHGGKTSVALEKPHFDSWIRYILSC